MQLQKFCLVLLIASLSGCESVANLIKERQEAREQAFISSAQESCKRYGFSEKTDAFYQCIQNDVNSAKAREAIVNAAKTSTKTSCTKTISGGMNCETN